MEVFDLFQDTGMNTGVKRQSIVRAPLPIDKPSICEVLPSALIEYGHHWAHRERSFYIHRYCNKANVPQACAKEFETSSE